MGFESCKEIKKKKNVNHSQAALVTLSKFLCHAIGKNEYKKDWYVKTPKLRVLVGGGGWLLSYYLK